MARPKLKIDVGTFDKRITFQTKTQTPDGGGGYTDSWADTATSWASIMPVKAWEKFQASQMETPISHRIFTRFRSDVSITTALRIKWTLLGVTRYFNITEVKNLYEEKAFLEIMAVENTAT